MRTRLAITGSMLVGAVVGAAGDQVLHAQPKPPVYMIAINEVRDQEGYATFPLLRSRSKITVASISPQAQERRLPEVSRRGRS